MKSGALFYSGMSKVINLSTPDKLYRLSSRYLTIWLMLSHKTDIKLLQVFDMRTITAYPIFQENDLQMRVFTPEFLPETTGGITLAIIFVAAILSGNYLRKDRHNLFIKALFMQKFTRW